MKPIRTCYYRKIIHFSVVHNNPLLVVCLSDWKAYLCGKKDVLLQITIKTRFAATFNPSIIQNINPTV